MADSLPPILDAPAGTRSSQATGEDETGNSTGGDNVPFDIGALVERAVAGRPYQRRSDDPLYRPLRIFALDPAASQLEGSTAVVNVPYEPIQPRFIGSVFEIDPTDGGTQKKHPTLNLDDRAVLLNNGRNCSASDPLFHQQMVYAVCALVYAAFQSALGRHLAWGFALTGQTARLRLRPYAFVGQNAFYDKEKGELAFGYFRTAAVVDGRNLPNGFVFSSLSHDIVAHEVTHALLDGLRAAFTIPSGPDVLAFHEGFADLVAVFQRFTYEKVLQTAISRAKGQLEQAALLTNLADQFGQTTGHGQALRSAIDSDGAGHRRTYDDQLEPHELGSVLVSAVFEAFTTVFKRKTARYVRLATSGTGVLPAGELPADLQAVLAEEASKLARQFLNICIRAIDYCPPVALEFGEFLRAVITADHDLVPDDVWGYREAWIDAFRNRRIYPSGVEFLSEDALLWRPPVPAARQPIKRLTFAELRFNGDPASPASAAELRDQARALGQFVTHRDHLEAFGLAPPGDLNGDVVESPTVQSIRSSRRVGPDGQVVFDLVAEVTQVRRVLDKQGKLEFYFYGGATIIIGPDGRIRYVVSKSVSNKERLARQREFMHSARGGDLWLEVDGQLTPKPHPFQILHSPAGDWVAASIARNAAATIHAWGTGGEP